MDYMVLQDLESAIEIKDLTTEELADELGVSRITINNWLNNSCEMSEKNIHDFYDFIYKEDIRLNKIKAQLYKEETVKQNEILLFHGSKYGINGDIVIGHGKKTNDFGDGFYCGESLEQSAMFVATYKNPSLYMLKFKPDNLKRKKYSVNEEWILTVAYNREKLNGYLDSKMVKDLKESLKGIDYIIAPIADNKMYEIIDDFIDGEITDIQCQHCLSATNLGMQYVFLSEKALSNITVLEKCYLCNQEKEHYLKERDEVFKVNMDKVKLARKQYRNQGLYIEDLIV